MRHHLRCLAALFLAATTSSCGGGGDPGGTVTPPPPPPPPPPAVAAIELNRDTATLVSQQTIQVTATTRSSNGTVLTGRTVSWQSSAAAVASVSTDGLVTALTAGETVVTATSEGKSASMEIDVHEGAMIGATGGTIVANGGKASLTIPAGALSAPVPITIEPLASPPLASDLIGGTAYAIGPAGTAFAQPVTVTIKYPELTGIDTAQAFYRLSKFENGAWVPLPGNTGGRPGSVVRATLSAIPAHPPAARVAGPPLAAPTHGGFSPQAGVVGIQRAQIGGWGWSGQLVFSQTPVSVFFGESFSVSATPGELVGGQPFAPVFTAWDAATGLEVTGNGLTASIKGTVPGGPYSYSVLADSPYICPADIRCFIGWQGFGLPPSDPDDPRWVYVDQILVRYSGGGSVVVGLRPVASVTVTPATHSMPPGQKATLTANLADAAGAGLSAQYRTITWATSNASVASVSQDGEVTAISPGSATITASAEGKSGTATVTVTVPGTTVGSVLVLPSSGGEVELGNTFAIQAWPYDAASKPILGLPVFWSTLDATKATVTQQGIVTGVGLGQVGIGALVDGVQEGTFLTVVPPYTAAPGSPSAGQAHSCLLRNGGTVWCWGDGTHGARGDGSNSGVQQAPVQVPGLSNYIAVSAGGHRTCGLNATGSASCWGENTYGQLGDGSTTSRSSPAGVAGGKTFSKIYAGSSGGPGAVGSFTCALEPGGTAWCWGWGSFGDGTLPAVHASPTQVVNVPAFSAIAVGTNTACGLSLAGEAVCFGGSGAPTTPAAGHTFTALAGGWAHYCGLKANGEAWCWGSNTFGQLGDGSTINRTGPVKVVGGPFTKIDAGVETTCGLALDQTAWCWGIHGRNGDGTPPRGAQGIQSQPTPVPVHGGRQFTEISVGVHTCARAADGTWCWGGLGLVGELGNAYRYNTPVKVKFP